jgi:hypothetical protein
MKLFPSATNCIANKVICQKKHKKPQLVNLIFPAKTANTWPKQKIQAGHLWMQKNANISLYLYFRNAENLSPKKQLIGYLDTLATAYAAGDDFLL